MSATASTDWAFVPKVWQDHISAYWDNKLVLGAFAMKDDTLKGSPGETVNYPYFKQTGAAQEPAQDEGLEVDKLSDDSFSCTVKEIGKAIGVKDKALVVSAARREQVFGEVQSQIGRVLAEKVDADLLVEINTTGSYTQGFTGSSATNDVHAFNVRNFNTMLVTAFGDRARDASVVFIHSSAELSLMNDTTAGFLKADANDPMYSLPGFRGRLFGCAIVVTDTMPSAGTIDGKAAYYAFACKPDAYGIITKAELNPEQDRDILAREWVWTSTMWYGVKSFHAKINAEDKKIARGTFLAL